MADQIETNTPDGVLVPSDAGTPSAFPGQSPVPSAADAWQARALFSVAATLQTLGQFDEARRCLQESLPIFQELKNLVLQ